MSGQVDIYTFLYNVVPFSSIDRRINQVLLVSSDDSMTSTNITYSYNTSITGPGITIMLFHSLAISNLLVNYYTSKIVYIGI